MNSKFPSSNNVGSRIKSSEVDLLSCPTKGFASILEVIEDIRQGRPGHIFPLKYTEGGVLKRNGHTEASLDLVILAGLDPVAVLYEIVDDDGSMARLPKLRHFAKYHNLKINKIM
ncbi:unnamed protein product [Lupinus luteus]|uniref:3,4-dihydroxy-2-butanone-4-phosphate synthase n=1 Tax=Lupinus luteus TaxID=3873 RepID=A0AAV1WK73_LUPLU